MMPEKSDKRCQPRMADRPSHRRKGTLIVFRHEIPSAAWMRPQPFIGCPVMETDHVAPDVEAAAREQLRRIAAELEAIRFRLLGIHTSLAAPSREGFLIAGPRDTEASVEILAAVECVVVDLIGPALRALEEAVREEPPPRGEESR